MQLVIMFFYILAILLILYPIALVIYVIILPFFPFFYTALMIKQFSGKNLSDQPVLSCFCLVTFYPLVIVLYIFAVTIIAAFYPLGVAVFILIGITYFIKLCFAK